MSARSSNELYMSARAPRNTGAKDRQADRRIALGRRHEHGLVGHRARAVPRVVVAVAEEDEEVELAGRPLDVPDERRARRALRSRASAARRASECGCSKTELRAAAELDRCCAAARPGNRRTLMPLTVVVARRQLVLPGDVVARAGREHFDVGVPREALGDVSGVQFGAAADVRAVALNDNRQLHWSRVVRTIRIRRRRSGRRRRRRRRIRSAVAAVSGRLPSRQRASALRFCRRALRRRRPSSDPGRRPAPAAACGAAARRRRPRPRPGA